MKNELMIGNYVQFNDENDTFETINSIYIDFEGDVKKYAYLLATNNLEGELIVLFQPIPLTEDWLVKLGFKPFVKDWQKNGVIIHTRKRGFMLRKSVPIIKHVHQLQNLYHALTGQQLTK